VFSPSKNQSWFLFLILGGPLLLSFQNCGKGFQTDGLKEFDETTLLSSASENRLPAEEPVPDSVEDQFYKITALGSTGGQEALILVEKLGANKSGFIQIVTQDLSAKAGIDYAAYAATLAFEGSSSIAIPTNAIAEGAASKKFLVVLSYTDEMGETKTLMKPVAIYPLSIAAQ
jgi:hypothetical protein